MSKVYGVFELRAACEVEYTNADLIGVRTTMEGARQLISEQGKENAPIDKRLSFVTVGRREDLALSFEDYYYSGFAGFLIEELELI